MPQGPPDVGAAASESRPPPANPFLNVSLPGSAGDSDNGGRTEGEAFVAPPAGAHRQVRFKGVGVCRREGIGGCKTGGA